MPQGIAIYDRDRRRMLLTSTHLTKRGAQLAGLECIALNVSASLRERLGLEVIDRGDRPVLVEPKHVGKTWEKVTEEAIIRSIFSIVLKGVINQH